jgi:diketogulonate reductase-like aldo/keto reductase
MVTPPLIEPSKVPYKTLHTGQKMPMVGVGFWKSAQTEEVAETALGVGYRHLDNAAEYGNEGEVGKALHKGISLGVFKREDVFVTTKLWNDHHDRVEDAMADSLKQFGLDYVDLWLMHWPVAGNTGDAVDPPIKDTWQRMEKQVDEGKAKAIGVSNFSVKKLQDVLSYARIKPAVLQVEAHVFWRNEELIEFAQSQGIVVTAYSPLASDDSAEKFDRKDDPSIFENPTVLDIAKKLGKSPAQVVLRWGLQRDCVVIPKASSIEHLKSNLSVVEFELPAEDFEALSQLQPQRRMVDGSMFCGEDKPYKEPSQIWDGE